MTVAFSWACRDKFHYYKEILETVHGVPTWTKSREPIGKCFAGLQPPLLSMNHSLPLFQRSLWESGLGESIAFANLLGFSNGTICPTFRDYGPRSSLQVTLYIWSNAEVAAGPTFVNVSYQIPSATGAVLRRTSFKAHCSSFRNKFRVQFRPRFVYLVQQHILPGCI